MATSHKPNTGTFFFCAPHISLLFNVRRSGKGCSGLQMMNYFNVNQKS